MLIITIFGLVCSLANVCFAAIDRNWHSLIGWVVVTILMIGNLAARIAA
jgi:hypothetical protein